jgi:hypothetical protein
LLAEPVLNGTSRGPDNGEYVTLVPASAGLTAGVASAASAGSAGSHHPTFGGSTYNCSHGIYAGYCGTQESSTGLYIAVDWEHQVIGTRHPQAYNAEFFWFADASPSHANNDKYAEFAPHGVASNQVMAEEHGHIVLAAASGAENQKWVYDGTGWKNVATGDVLEATDDGGAILAVNGPSSGSKETWTFRTP